MTSQGTAREGVITFMAECFWPGVTAQNVADAGERVRQASHTTSGDQGVSRYLGSILVPTDEIALVFLEAASIAAATELARQAAIPSERILEIVRLGACLPSGHDTQTTRQRSLDESSP
jgi:hypothetical protein